MTAYTAARNKAWPAIRSPQDWLPVGQRVRLTSPGLYLPPVCAEDGTVIKLRDGVVVEHLNDGGVAIRFDGYENAVDYTRSEACRMDRVN